MPNAKSRGADSKAPKALTANQKKVAQEISAIAVKAIKDSETADKKQSKANSDLQARLKKAGVSPNVFVMPIPEAKKLEILVEGQPMTAMAFRVLVDRQIAEARLNATEFKCLFADLKTLTKHQQGVRENAQSKMGTYRTRFKRMLGVKKAASSESQTDKEKIESHLRSIIKLVKNDDTTLSKAMAEKVYTAAFNLGKSVNRRFEPVKKK